MHTIFKMTSLYASMQAKYDIKDSQNEDIVARLIELYKFECAIMREHDGDGSIETDSGINHKVSQAS